MRALGSTQSGVNTGFFDINGSFHSGGGQAFDAVITISSATPFSAIEHELNEALGGGGQGSQLGQGSGTYGPTDLYRYSALNTPSFATGSANSAYYSVDGGLTSIAGLNQSGGGSDYGDFTGPNNPAPSNTGPCLIQSAYACSPADSYTTASPEYAMMESIGYDPVTFQTATPLPAALPLFATGLGGLGLLGWRRRRRASAISA